MNWHREASCTPFHRRLSLLLKNAYLIMRLLIDLFCGIMVMKNSFFIYFFLTAGCRQAISECLYTCDTNLSRVNKSFQIRFALLSYVVLDWIYFWFESKSSHQNSYVCYTTKLPCGFQSKSAAPVLKKKSEESRDGKITLLIDIGGDASVRQNLREYITTKLC